MSFYSHKSVVFIVKVLRRYKRFLVDVIFLGVYDNHQFLKFKTPYIKTIYIANTGAMLCYDCSKPTLGLVIYGTFKMLFKLIAITEADKFMQNLHWIGVDTHYGNIIMRRYLESLDIKFTTEPVFYKDNKKFRLDFKTYEYHIEVKHVNWKIKNIALFPDCKSLRSLEQIKNWENRTPIKIVYLVFRNDIDAFKISQEKDLDYYNLIKKNISSKANIQLEAYKIRVTPNGYEYPIPIPVL